MLPQEASFPDPIDNSPPNRREPTPVAGRIEPSRRAPRGDTQGAVPAALAASPDVSTYLQALRRRWVAAAAFGGTLAILAGLAAWFLMSPKYIAFGKVKVAYETPVLSASGSGGHGDFLTYIKTQANHIMSRPVIWAALKRDDVKRLNLESLGEDPAQFIEKELKVEFQDNSEFLTITLAANDAQTATALVKAIMDSYMDEVVYAEQQGRASRVTELDKALTAATTALKSKQDSLAEQMKKKPASTDPQRLALHLNEMQSRINQATNQQSSIRLDLTKVEAELASDDARIKAVKDLAVSPIMIDSALKADPKAQSFKAGIAKYQSIIDEHETLMPGQRWPTRVAAERRVALLQSQYKKRRKDLQEEMSAQAEGSSSGGRAELELARLAKANLITALKKRDTELAAEVVALNGQLAEMQLSDHSQNSLRDLIAVDEKFVYELTHNLRQEQLNLLAVPRVTKVQDAELQKKDMKKQVLGTAVAPVAVLLGVCMLLAWTEVRQRRIRSAGEVSRGLGIRVVGAVPNVPKLEHHLVGPNGEPDLEGHPAVESIDALRTMLLRDADDAATRMVMVTSATHGEGKTTVASHLASSLARAGRKTLLIDGDLRRPSAHQLFELPMQPGFSEVLLAEVELTDAVQATTLDGLSFMAAGQWDREVLHALARDGLQGILEKLQQEFDFIIIDSHPVLPATDSLLIGQRVDAVILSVLREVSQMPRVYAASQRLATLGIRVLGAVVNGADPEEALAATASARMVAH